MIVPRPPHNNWLSLLTHLRSKVSTPPAMFMFRNVFFWLEWPDDRKYAAVRRVKSFNLTTLLKTRREREILPFGMRSKCIVVPWAVNQMGTHQVNVLSRTGTKVFVDESYALLHHYRVDMDSGVNNPYLTDTRMADFAKELIVRAWRQHYKVGMSMMIDRTSM